MQKGLTENQKRTFWALFNRVRRNLALNDQDATDYRHEMLREEIGVTSFKDVRTNAAFEKVMSRLAVDAGDYAEAAKWSGGDAKRYRHICLGIAGKIVSGDAATTPERYVASVLIQGHLHPRWTSFTTDAMARVLEDPDGWLDIPPTSLRTVVQILNSEARKNAS